MQYRIVTLCDDLMTCIDYLIALLTYTNNRHATQARGRLYGSLTRNLRCVDGASADARDTHHSRVTSSTIAGVAAAGVLTCDDVTLSGLRRAEWHRNCVYTSTVCNAPRTPIVCRNNRARSGHVHT